MNQDFEKEMNTDFTLKPELAFDWIKNKKTMVESNTDVAQTLKENAKTEKIISQPTKPSIIKDSTLARENFRGDPKKERMFLWYSALFTKQEMTLDEFSKIIQSTDVMETEEFLFRHAPLKFSYLWRGKGLKFSNETIEKLKEELKK